jgi:competence protein ComEA
VTTERVVMVVLAALLLVPLYIKSRPSQNLSARPAFHVLSSGRMLIKVSGDVKHAGVYEVPANTVALNVIKMAQPLKQLGRVENEAGFTLPLHNGQAVTLATRPDGAHQITTDLMTVPERLVLGIPLDLATMSEDDFVRLPGIGPALAKRIVIHRQLNGGTLRINDLEAIEGIGEKKLALLRKIVQPSEIK